MEFSFIHVADIHLGRPFSDLSKYSYDENVKKIYKTAVEKTFNKIIDFALSKNVDFVLIAGDTFDSGEQDFASKLILKDGLKKLEEAGISVFLTCGNHDPLSSYNKNTFNYDENSKIKIIGLNTPIYCEIPLNNKTGEKIGVLRALSFKEEKFSDNPLKFFTPIKEDEKNLFNIALLHCDLNADSSSTYAPCSLTEMKNFNYNYWALGHIHIPSSDNGNIQYSGSIQGRNTKETGVHGIRYIKAENNQIKENIFVPLDTVRFEDINRDLSLAEDLTCAFNLIEEEINKFTGGYDLLLARLNLTGNIKFFKEINAEFYNVLSEKIKTDFSQKVYISQITNSTSAFVDEELLKEDEGITGEIYKTAGDENMLQSAFDNLDNAVKNAILNCNFSNEEYEIFVKTVKQNAKKECINLCNIIYNPDSEAQ